MTTFDHPAALLDAVGRELGTSDWITIDQKRIDAFAECTGDHQWIHVDPQRAASGPFGSTIAHGYLTLSLAAALLADVVRVENVRAAVNYGADTVRFPAPVPVDSRVRGRVRLVAAEPRDGMIRVVLGLTVEIDGSDRPALVADLVALFS